MSPLRSSIAASSDPRATATTTSHAAQSYRSVDTFGGGAAIEEARPLLQTPPLRRRSSGKLVTMPCIALGEWQASETPGFIWDNVAAGGVLATNVFFNIAVLRLATLAAGCPAPEDVDEDQGCSNKVYGLKPSSFLTTVIMVGQFSATALMPLVGTAVDYTSKRRHLGAASAWILCITTLAQASISKQTWFLCSIGMALSIASYVCHQVSVLSYLPGLSMVKPEGDAFVDDPQERYKVNSIANASALATQLSVTIFVSCIAFWFGLGDTATAAVAQGVVGSLLFVIYSFVWTGRRDVVSCAFRNHAATKVLPEGHSLFLTAVREVWNSWTTLRRRRPAARFFLTGYACAAAGMGSFGSLSVVFMHDRLHVDGSTTVLVMALCVVFAVPASASAPMCMRYLGARKTLICTIAYMVCTTVLAAFVLCSPSCKDRVWLFAPIWGVGFGVFYAANNAAWTELVPPDAVAQFMSLYYFSAQILGWAPPAAYAVLNQLYDDSQLALFVTAAWLALSLPFLRMAGDLQGEKEALIDASP